MEIKKLYKKYSKFLFIIYFLVLSAGLFGSLLGRGYILTLDMIFTPQMYPQGELSVFNIFEYLIHFSAKIIPADLLQKLILIGVLIAAGSTIYILIYKVFSRKLPAIIAGSFYMINPFVFQRLIAGQWLFLTGYALLPLFVFALVEVQRKNEKEKYLALSISLWIIVSLLNQHHFVLCGIIFTIFTIYSVLEHALSFKSFTITKTNTLRVFVIFLWALINLIYSSSLDFSSEELIFFASEPSRYGVFYNLLTFNGFWAEGTFVPNTLKISPGSIMGILSIYIFSALALISALLYWFEDIKIRRINDLFEKKDFRIYVPIFFTGLFGLIFSIGSNGIIGNIYRFLVDDIPFFRGMREPQKFLNLYVLAFTLFLAFGIYLILKFIEKKHIKPTFHQISKYSFLVFISLSVIISSLPMFFNLRNELETTSYPQTFYEVEKILNEENSPKTLIIPDEEYIDVNWNDKRIASPAKYFFDINVVNKTEKVLSKEKECDIDVNVIHEGLEEGQYYNLCFNNNDDPQILSKTLKLLDIEYIIVLNQNKASILENENYFTDEFSSEEISLFKVSP